MTPWSKVSLWPLLWGSNRQSSSRDESTTTQLGTTWQGNAARQAWQQRQQQGEIQTRKSLCSAPNHGDPIRICMRHIVEEDESDHHDNDVHQKKASSSWSVWVAWIDSKGQCHAFRRLPCKRWTEMIVGEEDGVDEFTVTAADKHIERSFLGHTFLFVVRPDDDEEDHESSETNTTTAITPLWNASSLDPATIVGGYRPEVLSTNSTIRPDDLPCHIVEVLQTRRRRSFLHCPCHAPLRGTTSPGYNEIFALRVREAHGLEPLPTTDKHYVEERIHRWPVCVEKDCFVDHTDVRKVFSKDLSYALSCLPAHARKALHDSGTKIYINTNFRHGPKIRPQWAKGLCFHPDRAWLERHQHLADKAGCVELYDVKHYLNDRQLWGPGGVLLHELSHAYHKKCLEGGYDNPDIIDCYQRAMVQDLYRQVPVHGPQGPHQRAYACQNAMEYFAELSTAFLGCPQNKEEEYNKWYPFNRAQIKEHDPRAYQLLCRLWKVNA